MIDIEKLKENIVDKRLKLSALMHNASSIMSESEVDAMKADCQRLHLYGPKWRPARCFRGHRGTFQANRAKNAERLTVED
tara:strand:- start:698 stop:937 length:240 start_codon:yes stop_codon:yes gene_type:complete